MCAIIGDPVVNRAVTLMARTPVPVKRAITRSMAASPAKPTVLSHRLLSFSNRYYIRQINTKGHDNKLLIRNLTNAVALDFDWAQRCIYWSDVTALGSSIKRLCEINSNETSTEQILHSATVQSPDGIAVDWVGRNLYWCDKGKDTIEVSQLDGKYRKVLIKEGLEEPRAIVLNPYDGLVIYNLLIFS